MSAKPHFRADKTTDLHHSHQIALRMPSNHPIHRALWLETIDQQLRTSLPTALAQNCKLANIRDGQLIFLVTSPLWYTKFRLLEQDIVELAQQLTLKVHRIHIKCATFTSRSLDNREKRQGRSYPARPGQNIL